VCIAAYTRHKRFVGGAGRQQAHRRLGHSRQKVVGGVVGRWHRCRRWEVSCLSSHGHEVGLFTVVVHVLSCPSLNLSGGKAGAHALQFEGEAVSHTGEKEEEEKGESEREGRHGTQKGRKVR